MYYFSNNTLKRSDPERKIFGYKAPVALGAVFAMAK